MSKTGVLTVGPLAIPLSEIDLSFARSSGPGGQNVNKVNSKVWLRWNVTTSPSLPEEVRARFLKLHAARLTTEGELVMSSQATRDQPQNVDDCLQKLMELLEAALVRPKVRRPTKPTKGSIRRNKEKKAQRTQKKEGRRAPRHDE